MELTNRITAKDIHNNLINLRKLVIEVTDSCNLMCTYCAYRDLYQDPEVRDFGNMKFAQIRPLLDYLTSLWYDKDVDRMTDVGFYGGEPLLNIALIRQVIDYLENKNTRKSFSYTMTTNGLLLDKYMDYLVEKNFRLLISLDGDESGQCYRLKKNGDNSFKEVYSNILHLRQKYPDYFKDKVNFHTIIHNKNSVREVVDFMIKEFEKVPSLSEITPNGIRKDKKDIYQLMHQSIVESIQADTDPQDLRNALGYENPGKEYLYQYLRAYSGNFYDTYNSLISGNVVNHTPTGTCHPFQIKLFVTVKGEILQCEQISHKWACGVVSNNHLSLDCEKIAEKYNSLLDVVQAQCGSCSIARSCPVCVFKMEDFPEKNKCEKYLSKLQFSQYQNSCLDTLLKSPKLYNVLINEIHK